MDEWHCKYCGNITYGKTICKECYIFFHESEYELDGIDDDKDLINDDDE